MRRGDASLFLQAAQLMDVSTLTAKDATGLPKECFLVYGVRGLGLLALLVGSDDDDSDA